MADGALRFLLVSRDSLTWSLSGSPGRLSGPRLAGLHRVPPHARRRRALAAAAARAVISAGVRVRLAGEDPRVCQFHRSFVDLFARCAYLF